MTKFAPGMTDWVKPQPRPVKTAPWRRRGRGHLERAGSQSNLLVALHQKQRDVERNAAAQSGVAVMDDRADDGARFTATPQPQRADANPPIGE